VGLSHILIKRTASPAVSIPLILLVLTVLGITFLIYAQNHISWMSRECFTTLPLPRIEVSQPIGYNSLRKVFGLLWHGS
jgi:hypothetical protein